MNFNKLYNNRPYISRLPWVDYAKGIAIILVVYRHVLGGYESAGIQTYDWLIMVQQSVYNFRMPLFFILAGFFVRKSLKKRSIKAFTFYKLNTIMYPYLIWAFLQLSFQIIFSRYANNPRDISDFLFILYSPRDLDQFWFLYALFLVSILFALFYCQLEIGNSKQLALGVLFHFLSTVSVVSEIGLLRDVLHYYLYFAIGNSIADLILDNNNKQKLASFKLLLILLPVFIYSQWYWINHQDLKSTQPFLFALIALLGSAFVFNLSFILERINKLHFIKIIGHHSLYIYIMHVIVQAGVRTVMVNLFGIDNILILLTIGVVVSIYVPIVFYNLTTQHGLWILYNFEKPKASSKKVAVQSS